MFGGMKLGDLHVTTFTDQDRGSSNVDIPASGGVVDPEDIGLLIYYSPPRFQESD